jgi:hypothetical protein
MDNNIMNVLYVIGWFFLAASWIAPYVMKKMNKNDMDRHVVGMILAAFACGVFLAGFVITMMK